MPSIYNKYSPTLIPLFVLTPLTIPSNSLSSLASTFRRAFLLLFPLFYIRLASQADHVDRASNYPPRLDGSTFILLILPVQPFSSLDLVFSFRTPYISSRCVLLKSSALRRSLRLFMPTLHLRMPMPAQTAQRFRPTPSRVDLSTMDRRRLELRLVKLRHSHRPTTSSTTALARH
jgi:hypothetical protein